MFFSRNFLPHGAGVVFPDDLTFGMIIINDNEQDRSDKKHHSNREGYKKVYFFHYLVRISIFKSINRLHFPAI